MTFRNLRMGKKFTYNNKEYVKVPTGKKDGVFYNAEYFYIFGRQVESERVFIDPETMVDVEKISS